MRTKKSSIRRIINPHESTDGFKSEQVMDEWIDFDDTKRHCHINWAGGGVRPILR
jgi:hypothetical protein